MKVISLFDGISCAYVALQKSDISITSYTAYEIDKYATTISKKNHPTIDHKGDVKNLKEVVECDILIGGSPCTDLSVAKKDRKGLEGEHSSLFWEYIRIKNLLNPKWFILENVASMSKTDKDAITKAMGVDPIMICASLVSAQRRKRYFWTNIPVTLPSDKGILLKHILEDTVDEKFYIKQTKEELGDKVKSQAYRVYGTDGKSVCLGANGGGVGAKTGLYMYENRIRRLTPLECERLQGLPDGYTAHVSDTQRYKCCGNAFNCDVVAHILRGIPVV
jgi:site-specific DNA-cytosine methylase